MLSPLYIALGNHINRRIEGISTEASQVSLKVVLYFPPVFHPSLNFYCIMGMNDIRLGAVCITPLSLRSACRWIDEHREMENLTGKTEYKRNTLLEGGGVKNISPALSPAITRTRLFPKLSSNSEMFFEQAQFSVLRGTTCERG